MLLQLKVQDHGYAEFVTEGTKFGLFERAKLPELIGRDARAGGPGQCGGPAGHWARHRHALQQLTALAQLGTPAAVAAVERIAAHFPERPGLRQVLLDAEERMRQNTWIPLQPASR